MGRTVPSFRNVLAEEKQEWKPFRNALPKAERKAFDEMWDIPKLYIMACSGSVSLVPFHPIAISILFHHYKELIKCKKQIEKIKNGTMRTAVTKIKEDLHNDEVKLSEEEEEWQEEEEFPINLDMFLY